MRVIYDTHTDTLTIVLRDEPVEESDEQTTGVIFDYDAAGNVVSMELLDASKRIAQPNRMVYELVGGYATPVWNSNPETPPS
jgi:YD repeat-containing protein